MSALARWLARAVATGLAAIAVVDVGLAAPTLAPRFEITPIAAETATRLLERATVQTFALGCDLSLRQGSGTLLAGDRILTNQHVIGAYRSVEVAADGHAVVTPSNVRTSADADLALLQAGGLGDQSLALAPYDPVPGEPVRLAGFPHAPEGGESSDGLVVTVGRVVDYVPGAAEGQPGLVMRVDVPVRTGMSGGPVLDEAGRLAGILFAVQSPTDDTLVIPASQLRRELNRPDLTAARRCAA